VSLEKFASTNQEHYLDLDSERHQYAISAVVAQTSLRGEISRGDVKCRLLSQASLETLYQNNLKQIERKEDNTIKNPTELA